jgi:hypothetical protein
MIYYIPNSDNRARYDDHLKFICAEIWYMFILLAITFYRKIVLVQGLRHSKIDFKSFPTTYYMPNSNNRARNDNRLKFAVISNDQARVQSHKMCDWTMVESHVLCDWTMVESHVLCDWTMVWSLEITANFERSSFLARLSKLGI